MDAHPNRLNLALLTAALGCASLPLIRFPFFEDNLITLTARDLLFGRIATVTYSNGHNETLRLAPDPYATVVFAALLAGFVVSLFPGWVNRAASSLLAAVSALALYRFRIAWGEVVKIDDFIGRAEYQPAFYVLLGLLTITALTALPFASLVRLLRSMHIPRYTLKRVGNLFS